MNSILKLTPNSIVGMTGIADRPVYFLTMNGQQTPTITVKGELKLATSNSAKDAEISIKWGGKLMKNINDAQVNPKILDATELAEFKRAAKLFLAAEPKKLKPLVEALVWTKMPFVNDLSTADIWKTGATGKWEVKAQDVKALLRKFADPLIWEQLGKMLAVDAFNGNHDRFAQNGHLVNVGNIMFQQTAVGIKVVGLDTFESKGNSSNLLLPGDLKNLDVLIKPAVMTTVAQTMTKSVASEIGRSMTKAGMQSFSLKMGTDVVSITPKDEDYFLGYVPDIERGMIAGSVALKAYLARKLNEYGQVVLPVRTTGLQMGGNRPMPRAPVGMGGQRNVQQKTIPPGVIDRMRYLKWI